MNKILFTLILMVSCLGILGVAEKTFAATDCITDEGGMCCDVSVNQFACSNVIVGATGCGGGERCCQIGSCADCITGKGGMCCDVSVDEFACSNIITKATGCGDGERCCQRGSCKTETTSLPMLPTGNGSITVSEPASTSGGSTVNLSDKPLSEILEDLIKWLLQIVILIAILMIIISGVMYMISAGDQQKADTAKKALTYAILGLLVVVLAYAIVNTLVDILT